MLTTDEYEKGGATALRELVEAGATPSQVRAFLDALDADEEAVEVDAEGRQVVNGRVLKLPTGHEIILEADGGFTLPGTYSPEVRRAIAAYMHDHPIAAEEVSHVPQVLSLEPLKSTDFLPGDHSGLSAEARLVELMRPKAPRGGLSPAAERAMLQSEGSAQMVGGLPLPGDSITLEELNSRLVIGPAQEKFSGQMVGGLPEPL